MVVTALLAGVGAMARAPALLGAAVGRVAGRFVASLVLVLILAGTIWFDSCYLSCGFRRRGGGCDSCYTGAEVC